MKGSERIKKQIELLEKCQVLIPMVDNALVLDDNSMLDWFYDKYNKSVDSENKKALKLRKKKLDSL